jgi:hypothetical protein
LETQGEGGRRRKNEARKQRKERADQRLGCGRGRNREGGKKEGREPVPIRIDVVVQERQTKERKK